MVELIYAHSSGVSLFAAQLTKCDGVFSDPKGLVFLKGKSSALPIQSKAEGELVARKKEIFSHFFLHKTSRLVI